MPGKIFINYRRDDERVFAARIRDRLAGEFGGSNVFMDVDNLMAGQRFDKELVKALAETDVFLAVIGPRWMELFAERQAQGVRDYVHEEIAGGLARGIVVVPVLIERAPLPQAEVLPEDIRELVLHQKHVVTHEQFGRDIAGLVEAIKFARKRPKGQVMPAVPWGWIGATAASVLMAGWVGAYQLGVPVWWPFSRPDEPGPTVTQKQLDDGAMKQVLAAQAKAEAEAAAKRKAPVDALADLKVEEDRQRAVAELKRKADEEAARRTPRVGQTFRDCYDNDPVKNRACPEMVVVPAGEFMMGEGSSQRKTTIPQPFAVGKFEVTFDEWEACVAGGGCLSNESPSDQDWGKGRRPVINVSWNDAKEYVTWLSGKTGKTYRLLSEAEWEYSARARSTTAYHWGDGFDASKANIRSQTVPVGQYAANAFGLHDVHGNVWEWCEDAYDASSRVLRGGSWDYGPSSLRSAYRFRLPPANRSIDIGFRLARTL